MVRDKQTTLRELQQIPSIGAACANDLWRIGIRRISDLKNKNPKKLYEQLNYVTGAQHDICMLYTFRCAVYFASTAHPKHEKTRWWYWKGRTINE